MTRPRNVLFFAGSLFLLLILANPVSADFMLPRITHVYFDMDGGPYHGSTEYTVTCYGYYYPIGPPPATTQPPGSYRPESVFRYSASCPDYGCKIYEPYYYKYARIDRCDLEIIVNSSVYTIRNFSALPYTHSASVPAPVTVSTNDTGEVYYSTPEYLMCSGYSSLSNQPDKNLTIEKRDYVTCDTDTEPGCIPLFSGLRPVREISSNRTRTGSSLWQNMTSRQFMQYIETCDPVSDPLCGGWTIDGTPAKNVPGLRPFLDAPSPRDNHCDTFLIGASRDLVVPEEMITSSWFDNENLAMDACELRVEIPSGEGKPVRTLTLSGVTPAGKPSNSPELEILTEGNTSSSLPVPHSPVESLYCGIMNFFGARC
jgi:hypothetical protein